MKPSIFQACLCVLLFVSLIGCSDNSLSPAEASAAEAATAATTATADEASAAQAALDADSAAAAAAEAVAVADATMAASSSSIPTGGAPTNPEAENTVKAFINLNGQLCAKIVGVRPLAMPDTAEVTCIEYTGGSSKVVYIVNLKTGELQKAG